MYTSFREFKEDLREKLRQIRPKNEAGAQFSIRCVYCGDSKKSSQSTHFGILLNVDRDDVPLYYNCFRCGESGVLSSKVLKDIGIYDYEVGAGTSSYNKFTSRTSDHGSYGNSKNKKSRLIMPLADFNMKNAFEKKTYLEGRLGVQFTFEECQKLKIVFSLGDLIRKNNISKVTVGDHKALDLDEHYLGFLTEGNDRIIFRQALPGAKYKRYEKYMIYQGATGEKFYAIPTEVDLLGPDDINIHIGEGALDALGIYKHYYKPEDLKNNIFIGTSGSDMKKVVEYFITEGFIGNVNYYIYRDAEVPSAKYKKSLKDFLPWMQHLYVIHNTLPKGDFGVPAHEINCVLETIK